MAVCSSEIFSSSVTACFRIMRISVLSKKWRKEKPLSTMSNNFSQAGMEEGQEKVSKIATQGYYKKQVKFADDP